jgi:2-keto-4-pentenoate hydratase
MAPLKLHPRVLAALRRQLENRRATLDSGAVSVGWKIGGDIAEVDALTGSAPLIGYLTTASLVPAGGVHDPSGARALRAETELLIELERDVDPGKAGPDSIAGVGVAIELVDVARPPDTMESIVAANVFHRAAVLGDARVTTLPPRAQARIWVDGELRETATAPTDALPTVEHVARLLDAIGERLHAGDRILAGSLTHVRVTAGSHVAAGIDGLERLAVRLAP